MYACDRKTRVAGFTSIMKKAERLADMIGLANWDLIVLRSPGTPAAGLLLVQAYQHTHEDRHLIAARRAGDLLVNIQLSSGGWFSEMPVHGNRLAWWFRFVVPGTTLDDDVTSGALRFLLTLWEVTQEPRYLDAATRGLQLLLAAQLPSGAWPLTWRSAWRRWLSPSFEDGPSLNDAATTGPIHACLLGARLLHQSNLSEAATRAGKWLMRARNPAPHAGWAQQYDMEGHMIPGRRFEPSGLATWESRHALEALQALAATTGDQRFCAPFPEAIDWLKSSALAPGCWARLYSVETNSPLYMDQHGNFVETAAQAKRPYRWTGDFGIPALFASLGLDMRGNPLTEETEHAQVARPLPGDTDDCPEEQGPEERRSEKAETRNPRARIATAGKVFAQLTPRQPSVCASALSPGQ